MLNLQLFALATGEGLTLPERFSEAGLVTLMGMGAVFAVLAILWACIEIMHVFLGVKEEKPAAKTETKTATEEIAPIAEVVSSAAVTAQPVEDDGALIAAITAAISAAMAEEGYTGGFRVVSFKRASASNRRSRF